MRHRNPAFILFNLASILCIASGGHAQAAPVLRADGVFWSAVGAVGQVDPRSANLAKPVKSTMTMAAPGTLIVRYGIAPTPELAGANGVLHLMADSFDPGAGASVNVSLVEVDIDSPALVHTAKLDPVGSEDAYDASGTLNGSGARSLVSLGSRDDDRMRFVTACASDNGGLQFDFDHHAYFVIVTLTWDAARQSRAPALRTLQIGIYPTHLCGS